MKKQVHVFKLAITPAESSPTLATFETNPKGFKVVAVTGESTVTLTTRKGKYILPKHATMNFYHGICAGIKVQVSLKKQVGEIRSWF